MEAPKYFNETAKQYFYFVVDELSKIEKLNQTDQPIIERLAFNLATVEASERTLMKDGFIVAGPHGPKEHPSVAISMKAQAKVLEIFKVLGLDASTRLKVDKNEQGTESSFIAALIG